MSTELDDGNNLGTAEMTDDEVLAILLAPRHMVEAHRVRVTPNLARLLLARNIEHNRKINPTDVLGYARTLQKGAWVENGQPINLSKTGKLLNGQNRLNAIIKAGVSAYMLVAVGIDEDAVYSMDIGRKRRLAQMVEMAGIPNSAVVTSLTSWIGRIQDCEKYGGVPSNVQQDVLTLIGQHPLVHEFGRLRSRGIFKSMPAACYAPMVLAAERYGRDIVDVFTQSLLSGANLVEGEPAFALREEMINYASTKGKRQRVRLEYLVAVTIKALRAHVLGARIYRLAWQNNEKWPTLPKECQLTNAD